MGPKPSLKKLTKVDKRQTEKSSDSAQHQENPVQTEQEMKSSDVCMLCQQAFDAFDRSPYKTSCCENYVCHKCSLKKPQDCQQCGSKDFQLCLDVEMQRELQEESKENGQTQSSLQNSALQNLSSAPNPQQTLVCQASLTSKPAVVQKQQDSSEPKKTTEPAQPVDQKEVPHSDLEQKSDHSWSQGGPEPSPQEGSAGTKVANKTSQNEKQSLGYFLTEFLKRELIGKEILDWKTLGAVSQETWNKIIETFFHLKADQRMSTYEGDHLDRKTLIAMIGDNNWPEIAEVVNKGQSEGTATCFKQSGATQATQCSAQGVNWNGLLEHLGGFANSASGYLLGKANQIQGYIGKRLRNQASGNDDNQALDQTLLPEQNSVVEPPLKRQKDDQSVSDPVMIVLNVLEQVLDILSFQEIPTTPEPVLSLLLFQLCRTLCELGRSCQLRVGMECLQAVYGVEVERARQRTKLVPQLWPQYEKPLIES